MSRKYQLYGFSSGGARGPHFTEPVFSNGESLFVQAASDHEDRVAKFVPFDEKIDLHEHKSNDSSSVGDRCTYAIVDNGDRLIFGDRDYVSRYLTQNIQGYIDTPYFLNECIKFTGHKIPEFEFVRSNRDLLELAVAVNSIKEFAKSTPAVRRWLTDAFVESKKLHYAKSSHPAYFGESKTIFGAWKSFALANNHLVAKSDRWSHIERDFLAIYDDDVDLANYALATHFVSCKSVLNNWQRKKSSEPDENLTSERLARILKSDLSQESTASANNMLTLRVLGSAERHESSRSLRRWIANALRMRKTSYVKISVQVYLISVALKVTLSLNDELFEDDRD
jgi:hypothetical protein